MNASTLCLTCATVLACAAVTAPGAGGLRIDDVYVSGKDGYHTYRIPALVVTTKGTLLAFCEGRKANSRDHGDIDLMLKRSTDGGVTFSAQRIVHEEGGGRKITIGNPCPVVDRKTGTIWLGFCRDNKDVFVTSSADDGLTWSKPRNITQAVKKPDWGWYATGPCSGTQLRLGPKRGRLIMPCDHKVRAGGRDVSYHSHIIYSDDSGKTWLPGGSTADGTNECQLVERTDGSLLLNMRRKAGVATPHRFVSVSTDAGMTWTRPTADKTLIGPRCQGSLVRYGPSDVKGKSALLFSNPASRTSRVDMTVRASFDGGGTWPVSKLIFRGHSAYSDLAVLPDGTIACLFEGGAKHRYQKIMLARFPMQRLVPAPAAGPMAWPSQPPKDCPFPQSKQFGGIVFTGRYRNYTTADTWYPSWAADGHLYSPWTDGRVEKMSSSSGPKRWTTGQARIEGSDPLKLKVIPLGLHRAEATPYGGRYPCGSLVHDGVWYYGTYCLDKRKYPWDVMGPFVGFRISRDFGKTWTDTPCTPAKPLFGESGKGGRKVKFGSPHFVDFGRNMQHSPDGKAYLTGHGATRPKAACSWISGDQVYLARVTPSPANINDVTRYEFFAGRAAGGKPVWTKKFSQTRPLLEWNDRLGCVTVTYNAPLKKYLMCVTDGGASGLGTYDTMILSADRMTGPWRLVTFMAGFGRQAYFVNIPSKFISRDGRTMWLCFADDWVRKHPSSPPGTRYAMCLYEVRLPAPGEKPPAATADPPAPPGAGPNRDARVNRLILDLFSKDKATRLRAVSALGSEGGDRAIDALGSVMRKGDEAMRIAAAGGLASAGADGSKVLAACLPNVSVACRLEIVRAVAAAAHPSGIVLLKVAMRDESPDVRAMAAVLLMRLAPDGAAETLKAMRTDEDARVRVAVRWAAIRLGGGRLARADKGLAAKFKGRPLKLDFTMTDLFSALDSIRHASGASIFVDRRALGKAGVTYEKNVTYEGELPLARALDTVLLRACGPGVDWLADGPVIRVASNDVLLTVLDRPAVAMALKPDRDPKATKAALKTLAQIMPKLDFTEIPVELALQFMTEVTGLKLHVRWDALKAAKVDRNTECTVLLTNVPFGTGLELLLDSAAETGRCAYAVCGRTVVISTREDLAALRKRKWPKGRSAAETMLLADLKVHLAGAKPGADSENSPLAWFAERGHVASTGRILGGLDAAGRVAACNDVLPIAVRHDQVKMTGFLLDQGADIETQDPKRGYASLHVAADRGRPALVSLLIARGANVNARTNGGATSLTLARASLARQASALKKAPNEELRKVYQAYIVRHKRTVELLLKHGATDAAGED